MKRIVIISALASLLPLGQHVMIGTGVTWTRAAIMLSFPTKVNAEEYRCSLDLSLLGRQGEYERKTYTRIGTGENSYFRKITSSGNKEFYQIAKETNDYIVLTETNSPYKYIFVTIIEKNTNEFFEKFLLWKDSRKARHPLYGACLVRH
tara:strand:+ start:10229 stop:10675 length:447 start_codon:yes stop_codon:yes gene_type:complete